MAGASECNESAVHALLESYSNAWRANDVSALLQHWTETRFRFYKAEEVDHFFTSWSDVGAYFRHNAQFHELVELEFPTVDLIGVSADTLLAIVTMRWDIQFAPDARLPDGTPFSHRGKAMGGNNHVLAMISRLPEGWRLSGWSETPDAPITYIAQLYRANVKAGFPPRN